MRTIRTYLQDELVRRCETNPRYSLRNFAKHLEMNPSLLSKILRGQVGVSSKRFDKICERMTLGTVERAQLATAEDRRRAFKKQEHLFRELQNTSMQMRDMADQFQVIADWYHYAILELVAIDSFQSDERWIAKKIGVSYPEVLEARERLVRLGMLSIDENGKWKDTSGNVTNSSGQYTTVALRKLQTQVLNLAIGALETVPVEKRLQGSMTLAIDAELVPSAKEKIVAFQRALATSLQEQSKNKNSVYQITVSFFPVTAPETTPETTPETASQVGSPVPAASQAGWKCAVLLISVDASGAFGRSIGSRSCKSVIKQVQYKHIETSFHVTFIPIKTCGFGRRLAYVDRAFTRSLSRAESVECLRHSGDST
jgi:uncharacterized protein (TIGR02147 family)